MPAICSFRRTGLRNACANARHDSPSRPPIAMPGTLATSIAFLKRYWEEFLRPRGTPRSSARTTARRDEAEGDDVEAHGHHGHKFADKLDDRMG